MKTIPSNFDAAGRLTRGGRNTFIVLLRGVNVVGANSLPTKDFVRILESLGLRGVRTYIQTGNAVFRASEAEVAALPARIASGIRRRLGFAPGVMLLRLDQLERAVAANPYPAADAEPKSLHLMFLASAPENPELATLTSLCKATERFSLKGTVCYFYAPEGVARSKAFARAEILLGVPGTARNWRTARKVLEIAREVAGAADRRPTLQSGVERGRKPK